MAIQKPRNAYAEPHDPDDRLDYGFEFKLHTGETIANAIVQVVDSVTDEPPVVPTDLIIDDVSFGATEVDRVYGVTFWVTGGTPSNSYYIKCQITTDSSPTARIITRTMRLLCADQ